MAIKQVRSKLSARATLRGNISIYRNRDINDVLPSQIVEQQFPEFIRNEYPKMVDFAKAYFSFLEQTENGKIDDLKNIDKTSGEYILRLRNEFAFNATKFNFLEDDEFIRYAKFFYSSKGTEESIKFLFRVMFDEAVEIDYPSERIFKTSTARWFQEQSVKVVIGQNSLSPQEFIGNYLQIRNSKGDEQTIEVSDVIDITDKISEDDPSTIFEVFFTTELLIPVSIGDSVFGTDMSSTIIPSLTSLKIISPGSKFRIGQVINLDSVTGSGAVAVITNVRSNGEIRNVKFLKFGKNYTTNFYLGISPEGVFTDSGASFSTTGTADINKAITDITEGFLETNSILRSDYVLNDSPVTGASPFSNYVYSAYTGVYVSQSSNRQIFFLEEDYSALILSSIGAVCTYPGKYLDQTGMASNSSVLQDNNLYQDFSYVIKTTSDIEEYKETITALAHPAGFKMFGELSVENVFDSDTNLQEVTNSSDLNVTNFDFTASDTIDRRITFTRASNATYFDSTGTLQNAASNVARIDYNPTTLLNRGLLIEESRTNSYPNNTMVGAVAGTPGTVPTGWTVTSTTNGITRTIVGTGVEDGINYIDIRYTTGAGTTTAASNLTILPYNTTTVAAVQGQTWTGSVYVRLLSGSFSSGFTNFTMTTTERSNTGLALISSSTSLLGVTTAALRTQRFQHSRTLTNASTAYVTGAQLSLVYPSGASLDVTLRIGLPQLENNNISTGVSTATVAGGGSGYAVGNVLTVVGGTGTAATLTVSTVSSGVITAVTVTTAGSYSVFPTSPVSVTGGAGTDATFTLTPVSQTGFATSVIKTSTTALTRSADSAVITGSNFSSWYNATEGTLFAQADTYDVIGGRQTFYINDGTTSNSIHIGHGASTRGFISAAGVAQLSQIPGTVSNNVSSKVALAYKANDGQTVVNGVASTADTTVTIPTVNTARLGGISTINSNLNGHIQKVSYYPKRLTQTELQTLTT